MEWIKRIFFTLIVVASMMIVMPLQVFADDVGDTGDTDIGDIGGTNVYTFSYNYDSSLDAICLTVTTKHPLSSFGNTCSHTFTSASDTTTLHTKNPRLGTSLESAIQSMITNGGYNLTVDQVKTKLGELGFYDKGNGVWKTDSTYLTYIDAVKIRPMKHTVAYNANGGSGAPGNQTKNQGVTLTLSSTKPTRTGYSFVNWTASIGGNYNPGGSYTHDQDGGTVTMKANWKDDIKPSCSVFSATPNQWSSGKGTVKFTAQDKGSGLASAKLRRYSYVTGNWSDVKTWTYSGTTSAVSETYTQTAEGVYKYQLILTDKAGNVKTLDSNIIYLDHSAPKMSGLEDTTTGWTKVAPKINVDATDYLKDTTYMGSGVASIIVYNEDGVAVASGTNSVSYILTQSYEGIYDWTVVVTDNVGHSTSDSITTRYDCTPPGIDGTESTYVTPSGGIVSGYVADNIIDQHLDDEAYRSDNSPNITSGIKQVTLYRVTDSGRTIIRLADTYKVYSTSNTHNDFDMYYEIAESEDDVNYYMIYVRDFAGNVMWKKLTSQLSLLGWFHTTIDRSSYE